MQQVWETWRAKRGDKIMSSWETCPVCNGTAKDSTGSKCKVCNGEKIISTATGKPPSISSPRIYESNPSMSEGPKELRPSEIPIHKPLPLRASNDRCETVDVIPDML